MTDEPTLAELFAERERLLIEKEENNEILTSCRAQLAAAVARRRVDGRYSDPQWFAAATTRAQYAGRRDQQIANRLSELRRLMHEARQRTVATSASPPDGDPIRLLIEAINLIGQALSVLREKANKAD